MCRCVRKVEGRLPKNIKKGLIVGISLTQYFHTSCFLLLRRINKKGSQKDMEQKRAGAYFFYDQDDVADDIDDDDL